jgi:hypothetical protein
MKETLAEQRERLLKQRALREKLAAQALTVKNFSLRYITQSERSDIFKSLNIQRRSYSEV